MVSSLLWKLSSIARQTRHSLRNRSASKFFRNALGWERVVRARQIAHDFDRLNARFHDKRILLRRYLSAVIDDSQVNAVAPRSKRARINQEVGPAPVSGVLGTVH